MLETRAKIVCTLGPSSNDQGTIKRLILAGMDVARLNFSHGTQADHRRLIAAIRAACAETGKVLAIMGDLQGPKIRVGLIEGGGAELVPGREITITTQQTMGNAERVSTSYERLPQDVGPGEALLLDDGMIALRVKSVEGSEVLCEVVIGGFLKNNKGINIPGASLSVEATPPKDLA
ncbi:MAG: pyruvate kinase, partial [bacterium]